MEDKSIMDCAVKNLEKTFDIKQKALVNKLHNMHWLKNMSPPSNPGKIKIIYKHIQERERDHDKNNKLEDKGLLTENIKTSVEESDKYRLMDTYKKYLPNDAMSGSDENVWNKDVNLPHSFQNSKKLVNLKDKEEKEDMLMITERIITAKLDAQFYTDKMQKDQSNMSQNNAEDITQNAVYSNLSNIKTKSNKTADVTYQNKNINKNAILQKQQTVSKQSASKMQESFKKNASMLNFAIYKNKTLEETEKVNNLSEKSDLLLNEERRNKKIIDEKQCHQKADSDCNLKTTFVMQYKNSTFTNPMQNKSMLRNIEHTAIYGRNSLYNDPRFDNKSIGNAERKSVINSEYISTNIFSKSNVKSTIDKKDTLVCNNENKVNLVNAKTYLMENKKCANLSIGHIRKQEPMLGRCHKEMKKIDKSKINIDQQNIEINNATDNEQTNSFKHSSNLLSNRYTVETPADAIHQHSLKLEYSQHMDNVKKLGSSQTTWNNCLSNSTVQKNATIVNSQRSIQNMRFNVQQTIMQATDQTKQMSSREPNSSKFYNQPFSIGNAMPPSQIPNTFNVALYESNVQTSNDSDTTSILETAMNRNKEKSDIFYKYTPNIQQRSGTTFSDFTGHSISSGQTRKWNSCVDSFHVDPYNIMQTYNSGAFDPNDFNNTHIRNSLPHPIIYAPSPNVQTRNPQLQYPLPVSYNPSCTNYIRVIPNTTNQLNNFNNIGSMHDQQLKYIPCMQMNNYIRGTHSDLSNCTVQPRNAVDNVPMKSNQHYKKCQDNSRMVYNVSRYVTPLSYSGVQKDKNFMPAIGKNQCSNAYFWQNQKDNQNAVNYMQMSKYPKSQMIQDLACDDNESENIPPIISPKEFITNNVSFSNKTEQFTARV